MRRAWRGVKHRSPGQSPPERFRAPQWRPPRPGSGRDVSDDEIDRIQAGTRHAWYAHFWRDDRLLVVHDDARFSMHRHDQSTCEPAVDHGLRQGLRCEWLDFPTGDSAGTLA